MSGFGWQIEMVRQVLPQRLTGRVATVTGLTVGAVDLPAPLGAMCRIRGRGGMGTAAQVVGFAGEQTLLMPLGETAGLARGDAVTCQTNMPVVPVSVDMLGRVLDAFGRPIDGGAALTPEAYYPLHRAAPDPLKRRAIDKPLPVGVRPIDAMTTCGLGQRMGIFAGTGVGKSVLMGMIARYTAADVTVVALVGERGREVGEFLQRDLGEEGLKRCVVVVSTSDQPPVLRVRAPLVATAVAEHFRDQGCDVLLLMDSLTRMAMAQRQIGLASGEPPATKGYTPSVFAQMPPLMERAGRTQTGSITALYTVLVEGDDINEPISDAARGVLDGHVWLSRALATRGQYPAVSVLDSISRVMTDVVDDDHRRIAREVASLLAAYNEVEDLVNIGAYAAGSNPLYDLAIRMRDPINAFLAQGMNERADFADTRRRLGELDAMIQKHRKAIGPGAASTARGAQR